MSQQSSQRSTVIKITAGAMLTALVVILQLVGSFIRFGQFSVSLVLLPIVIGAAMFGPIMGGWLGLVFGAAVFLSGDAAFFFTIHPSGTIVTVLAKGFLAGLCAGGVFTLLKRKNTFWATFAAALVCPIVNTAIFLVGCLIFFYPTIVTWTAEGGYSNPIAYLLFGMVGLNFVFELIFDLVLAPSALRIVSIFKKRYKI